MTIRSINKLKDGKAPDSVIPINFSYRCEVLDSKKAGEYVT